MNALPLSVVRPLRRTTETAPDDLMDSPKDAAVNDVAAEPWLTATQLADLLGMPSPEAVRRLARLGEIPSIRLGARGQYRFQLSQVCAALAYSPTPTSSTVATAAPRLVATPNPRERSTRGVINIAGLCDEVYGRTGRSRE